MPAAPYIIANLDNDEDEVQEITAASTPMKKKKSVCVTCNQTFVTGNWFLDATI